MAAPTDPLKGRAYGYVQPTDGSTRGGYEATATLIGLNGYQGPFLVNGGLAIPRTITAKSNTAGLWSMEPYGNDQISPVGSYYLISEPESALNTAIAINAGADIDVPNTVGVVPIDGDAFTPPVTIVTIAGGAPAADRGVFFDYSSGAYSFFTFGSGLTMTGTTLTAASGSGTVTSVAQSFTGGIISVGGSPITTSGTLALTVAGTSGGIPYFSSASTWVSSAALAAGALVIGGGPGAAPSTTTTPNIGAATGTSVTLGGAVNGTLTIKNDSNQSKIALEGETGNIFAQGSITGTEFYGGDFYGDEFNGNIITTGTGTLTLSTFTLTAIASGNVVVQGGALGTPASGVATNLTGTASGLTAGAAPASGITGTTLASNVVTSSLTSVGTIATGVWNAGAVTSSGGVNVQGQTVPASGSSVEIAFAAGNGSVTSYNRTGSAYTPLVLAGSEIDLSPGGVTKAYATSSGFFIGAGGAITSSGAGGAMGALSFVVPGTGVATAAAVNVGGAGAFVLFNGAGGTPSSLTGTNITGTASGLTAGTASAVAVGGVTGMGTGVATFLATPSSANLAAAVTNETGSDALVFSNQPTFSTSSPGYGITSDVSGSATALLANATGTSIASFTRSSVTVMDVSSVGITLNTVINFSGATSGTVVLTVPAVAGSGTITLPAAVTGTVITTGNLSSITGTGTLTSGATGAGFTIALTTSTVTGNLPDARNTVSNTTTTSMANLVTVGTLTGGATGAGFTVALSTSTITGSLADARLSANVPLINAANTWTGANVFSAKPVTLSGNQSVAAWTTTGTGLIQAAASYTDTSSSGTVAVTTVHNVAAPTLLASSATTYTDSFVQRMAGPPVASTNVTQTRAHTLGILDATSAASAITGGLVVATAFGTAATSVGIGGGNINAGGTITTGGTVNTPSQVALALTSTPDNVGTGPTTIIRGGSSTTAGQILAVRRNGDSTDTFQVNNTGISLLTGGLTLPAAGSVSTSSGALFQIDSTGLRLANGLVGFTANTNSTVSVDASISRKTTGQIQIGTGAANASGDLYCTNLVPSGTLTVTGLTTLTGGLKGTTTNNDATALNVGEYVLASVVQGSATALTTATPKTVTSISLTAGDWDVTGVGALTGASTGTEFDVAVGTTTNSFTGTVLGDTRCQTPTVSLTGADASLMIPAARFSLSGTTTVYLIVQETFTIGTPAAYGRLSARRVR